MLQSCSKLGSGMMRREGGDGLRTVDCLRGRLLAERVVSKAANAEAELMATRLEELERQVAVEIKRRDKAEKRLNRAIKKLESLKLMDDVSQVNPLGSSVSSSSSACFSEDQRLEERKPDLEFGNSRQCGAAVEENIVGDKSSGNSSVSSPLPLVCHQEGSWSSVGTGHSQSKQEPSLKETGCDSPVSNASREVSAGSDEPHKADFESNLLALVPTNMWSSSVNCKPDLNSNVQEVLEALRHVKEQLKNSIARSAAAPPHHGLCIASE